MNSTELVVRSVSGIETQLEAHGSSRWAAVVWLGDGGQWRASGRL